MSDGPDTGYQSHHEPIYDHDDEAAWVHEMSNEPEQPEPFDERLKDIQADEVIISPDGIVQVNGHTLDGRKVWILLHLHYGCTVRTHQDPL